MSRPRPVLVYGIVIAVLSAISESADAANVLPPHVFPWIRLGLAVAAAIGGAVYVQTRVTPVSDPRDSAMERLVPERTGSRLT